MQKLIILSLALFLFLHSPVFGEERGLASTGYGGSAPPYEEEEYESINYGSGSGSSSSGYGTGYGGGSTPPYEEHEETYEEGGYGGSTPPYEESYEEEYEETYEEHYEESNNYGGSGYGSTTPSYEEEYESGSSYYGGYGSTPPSMTEEYIEEYGSSNYGYGGNPSYENGANTTYTENYEESYYGNGENGESGSSAPPFVPTSLLTGFVVDIHFLAGDPRFQYIAYHYCSDLYPGYTQCDIYNGTAANSKLVATEIIVTAEIFAQLPMEERKLWHSHAFAVTSGILVSPNTPADQELAVMASVMNSYGKVTDFYHSYQNFPFGGAKLAYGLAADSQINATIADQLDQSLGLSTTWQQRAEQRKNLNPTIIEGADDYLTSGQFPQYVTQMFPVVTDNTSS